MTKNKRIGNERINAKLNAKGVCVAFAIIVIAIILTGTASALGISPAQITTDFEADGKKDFKLRLLNNNKESIKVLVYAKGDLAEYIRIGKRIHELSQEESEKEITYSIDFPKELKPGQHTTDIVIMQIPDTFSSGETTAIVTPEGMIVLESKTEKTQISAAAGVVSKLKVKVPYPGKYMEASLLVSEANIGKPVYFTIPLMNFGNEDVAKAKATIKVLTPLNQEVARIETGELSIKAKEQDKLVAEWIPAVGVVNPGPYYVIVTVDYDNRKITLEKRISIGEVRIEITKIDTSEFRLGEIAKFDMQLSNEWNQKLSNIYAEIFILGKDGTVINTFKTITIDIDPLGTTRLTAYWDTKDISVGAYTMKIVLHYAEKTTEKIVDVSVNIDSITTSLTPTALAITRDKGAVAAEAAAAAAKRDNILIIAIIVLVAINIAWLVYIKKIKGKGPGRGSQGIPDNQPSQSNQGSPG